MVQIFQTDNPQGRLAETLGLALGGGLANMANTFYANKAIDKVLEDPQLKDVPVEQRMGALQKALMGFGEQGQQFLKTRLSIEEGAEKRKQDKIKAEKAEREANSIAQALGLDPESVRNIAPENLTKIAKHLESVKQHQQLNQLLGGQGLETSAYPEIPTQQPSPYATPDRQQAQFPFKMGSSPIQQQETSQQALSPQQQIPNQISGQKKPKYSPEQIAQITALNPNVGRVLQSQQEAQERRDLEKEKLASKEYFEKRKEDRNEIREYSKPFHDLVTIDNSVKKLEKAKDLIESGKVDLDENFFRRVTTGFLEDQNFDHIANLLKTDEQKQVFSYLKDYFKTKDIGGSNPSTKEVLLSLSTLPSENIGYGANIALINELLKDAISKKYKAEKINEIRRSGEDLNFGQFQQKVEDYSREKISPMEEQFRKENIKSAYRNQIKDKRPKKGYVWAVNSEGKLGELPVQNIPEWEKSGGMVFNGK